MEKNQVDINLSTDIKTDNLVPLNITLMSRDINNNSFLLKFKSNGADVQLNNSFTVDILSVFPNSKIEILTQAVVYGNTAVWEFDTKYITRNEVVSNYVYVKKDGAPIISADANAFTFNVGLSKIDGNAGKTAETYDRNYEKVLHEFEVAINLTKDEWAQMADEARNFVDEIKDVTVDQFVENKMGEELANLEVNYATRLAGLETKDNQLTAQLAQTELNKISKGEVTIQDINKNAGKFDESYLSEELLSQITGTTPIAPLPADYSVTKDKLAFNVLETTRSKNLYNKDIVTLQRYISNNGTLVFNGTYNTSDYIEIEPMTDYSFNHNYFTLAYYDSDKQFISYSAYTSKQISTPPAANYIRFSFVVALTDVFQLEKGHESTSYADYHMLPSSSISGVSIEQLTFSQPSKNLFNKETVTTNRFISATGELLSNSIYTVTDFIPVEQKTYALNKLGFGKISCFDSSRMFIASVDLIGGKFTPASGAEFVRFTVATVDLDSTQLEEGLFSTSYEDYEIRIPANKITGLNSSSGASKEIKRVTVGASNSDFTSINDALDSITDNNADNRYEIFVKIGTYIETFRTKHYVDIIGEDKYKTIIDYTGDVATWNDTSTVFAESNMTLSNLTLIGTDTKYPLHIDKSTGAWDMLVENVRCIHKGSLTDPVKAGTPVGIGLYPYQNLTLRDCTFIYDDVKGTQAFGASGVYFHNISDVAGTGYRKLLVERCKIKGTTYGYRPNAVSGTTSAQKNDAYIVNNDITATHAEYYFAEESTDESWNIFAIGNKYTKA